MDIREIAEFWNSVDEGIDAEAKDGALYAAGKKAELTDVRFGKKNGKDVFKAHILDVKREPFSKTNGSSYQPTAINDRGSIIFVIYIY